MPAVWRLIAGLACATSACLPAHALASVRTDDAAATRAYLGAIATYKRGATAEVGASVIAIEARAEEIGGECPSALTYAPRDAAFGELGEEAETTAFLASVAPMRSMVLRLAQTIEHLRWSDRRLTRLVRTEAVEERAFTTLALPDVCADIAAWRTSGYAALPQSATRFATRMQAIESLSELLDESREATIMHLLRPYETPAQSRIARHVEHLEAQVDRRLGVVQVIVRKKLEAALGVSAL